jgi:hypothetical protein
LRVRWSTNLSAYSPPLILDPSSLRDLAHDALDRIIHGDCIEPEAAAERSLFLDSHVKAGLPICATPERLAQNPDIKRLPECSKVQAKK